MADTLDTLTGEIRRRVSGLGYELVDLRQRGSKRRIVLQVRIDRPDAMPGDGITVDECAAVSRSLQAWLDETAVVGPRYVLEVSSPGIERPIRWLEHWARYAGQDVRVRIHGRGRIQATIVRVLDGQHAVVLRPDGEDQEITVPVDEARDATLVVDWSKIDRADSGRAR